MIADRELTGAELRRMLRLDDKEYQAELAADLATFKGPLDGRSKAEQIVKFGKMLEADRICFANLQQASSDTLTRMAARTK